MLFPSEDGKRKPVRVAVILASMLFVTGCGIGKPKPLLSGPPAAAQVGPAIPVAPVERPLESARFSRFPCGILESDQVAALIVDPPEKVARGGGREGMLGCAWSAPNKPTLGIYHAVVKPNNLAELVEVKEGNPQQYPGWRELSIDGIPVAEYVPRYIPGACDLYLGISDTEMLLVEYAVNGPSSSQYWGDDSCAGARKAAEFVIANLRRA
ncbi:DUF3558 domain-containing protein [Amycolatopsis decaplanina]|uniref:DUF3558 domain-containing protein n=1 Tax=Amycolatopsis decaplanina TaxID=208441 RepID=UPI001377D110|nr:DUF3558 domain-containing protein [Amycolatopsis decaplanina]